MGGRLSQPTRQPVKTTTNQPITLNFWGVFDDPAIFQPIIAAYQTTHPNVTINYSRKEASLYEFVSLNLLASQDGPDVWLIPADWLPKHRDKLQNVPAGLLAKQNPAPAVKRRLFQPAAPPPDNATVFSQTFTSVTAANNLIDNQVAAIPLAVDTLGLYGNTDLLAAVGQTTLPITWEAIVDLAKKTAKRTTVTVTDPVIGLGASANVSRASDIVATLMMQSHTPMISPDKSEALYNQAVAKATGELIQPGITALDFYTSFASPTKANFSWSSTLGNDYQLFAAGQLPLLVDYSFRIRDLQQQSPTLQWQTAPLPQISQTDRPVTLATALVVGVPIVSDYADQAWDFVQFLTNKTNALAYARAAGRPPARIDLATDSGFEPRLRPFIHQLAWATGWYRNEINKTDIVFKQAIDAVLAGQTLPSVIDKLTKQVTHILRDESYE